MCIRDRALIGEECHRLVDMQYNTYNRSLLPLLEKQGIRIITKHEAMTEKEREFADRYFDETVYPVLTPMAVDPSRPFPLIRNKTLNICLLYTSYNVDRHYTALISVTIYCLVREDYEHRQ